MIKLFVFDMDGVVFEGHNFWLDMHSEYDTREKGLRFYKENEDLDYSVLFDLMAKKFWKGVHTAKYFQLVTNRKYVQGIHSLISYLKEKQILTAIVSTGPYELAKRAKEEIGINFILSNRLLYNSKNKFTGESVVEVDDKNKYLSLSNLLSNINIKTNEVCSVGDSANDLSIARNIGCSFAYNSKCEELNEKCKYQINKNEIFDIASILEEEMVKGDGKG